MPRAARLGGETPKRLPLRRHDNCCTPARLWMGCPPGKCACLSGSVSRYRSCPASAAAKQNIPPVPGSPHRPGGRRCPPCRPARPARRASLIEMRSVAQSCKPPVARPVWGTSLRCCCHPRRGRRHKHGRPFAPGRCRPSIPRRGPGKERQPVPPSTSRRKTLSWIPHYVGSLGRRGLDSAILIDLIPVNTEQTSARPQVVQYWDTVADAALDAPPAEIHYAREGRIRLPLFQA